MKAVVADALNQYSVQEVDIAGPKTGEVLIDIKATGICHTDLSVINGTIPQAMPLVLGHEGAGIVREVGPGVEHVVPGDHVVLSWTPVCGNCYFCDHQEPHLCGSGFTTGGKMFDGTSRVTRNGEELNVMTMLGCMAEQVVAPAVSVIKVDKDIPMPQAALIGCGVMTGVGAAIKTAEVKPGSTVAIFGCGGIGLSIVQGAKIAGAGTIIAVDLADNKLQMAKEMGATHGIKGDNAVEEIMALTGGIGVDYAFEAVGVPALMTTADQATRRGGTLTIVGVGKMTETFDLNALGMFLGGKTYKGCYYGNTNPKVDFPNLLQFYQNGQLNLDDMITQTYSIDEAPQAIADLESGKNARGVIIYD